MNYLTATYINRDLHTGKRPHGRMPVEAIYPDMDVPDELQEWIELKRKG